MMTGDLEQKIRERAYQIWDREGRIDGRADAHWHAAKLEIATELAETEGTPGEAAVIAAPEAAPAKAAKRSRRTAPAEPKVSAPAAKAAVARRTRAPAKTAQ